MKKIAILSVFVFSFLLGGCTFNINNSKESNDTGSSSTSTIPTLSVTSTPTSAPEDNIKINNNSSLDDLDKNLNQIDNLENIDIDSSGVVNE